MNSNLHHPDVNSVFLISPKSEKSRIESPCFDFTITVPQDSLNYLFIPKALQKSLLPAHIKPRKNITAFLMYLGNETYENVRAELWVGRSTVICVFLEIHRILSDNKLAKSDLLYNPSLWSMK